MEILKKIAAKEQALREHPTPTIAFLGDSVTQGCFEVYKKLDGNIETIFDQSSAYHTYLKNMLSLLFPGAPVNIINAGISGDQAPKGYLRLERDVLAHHPDLTVVCYGLNDNAQGEENLPNYCNALDNIFRDLLAAGSEVIFMTPNMQNTAVSPHLPEGMLRDFAGKVARRQLDGMLDRYVAAAKEVAARHNVKVCDVYAKWKRLNDHGANTTELLANYINHPRREMNYLFAASLLDTMME